MPRPLPDLAGGYDFYHADAAWVDAGQSILQIYARMTAWNPLGLRAAFAVRDALCRLAGLQTIGGFGRRQIPENVAVGDKLDFFDVQHLCTRQLVLSSSDRHLVVTVILHLDAPDGTRQKLSCITTVTTHNLTGKIYMLPVAPAHGVIVRQMLKNITRPAGNKENNTCPP